MHVAQMFFNLQVAAAYAEEIFNTSDVWEFVLSEEPSLKDRILSFFKGANKKYSFEPGMTKAAKKWLSEYKKLFSEVSAYNKGRNVAENVGASEGVRKIERIGRIVDENTNDNSAQNTLLRTLKAENAQKSTLTNMNQEKMHVSDSGERYALKHIVGKSGTDYGIGVYLDSTLLSGLTENERIDMVKEYVKELGGKDFTAYDKNKNAIQIHIAEAKRKFKNKSGKRVPVNKDLTSYLKNTTKQESIALVDELIITSKFKNAEPSSHSHDWLDNYGKNDWEYWKTYVQDQKGEIWEATLNICNSEFGEKILYDISPIKKVERSVTSDTASTGISIAQKIKVDNSFDENSSKNVDDGSRAALKKSDKEFRDEVKAKADERVKKEREKAKAYAKEKIAEAKEKYDEKTAYGKAYTCE